MLKRKLQCVEDEKDHIHQRAEEDKARLRQRAEEEQKRELEELTDDKELAEIESPRTPDREGGIDRQDQYLVVAG